MPLVQNQRNRNRRSNGVLNTLLSGMFMFQFYNWCLIKCISSWIEYQKASCYCRVNLFQTCTGASLWVRPCGKPWVKAMKKACLFLAIAPWLVRGDGCESWAVTCSLIRTVLKNPYGAVGVPRESLVPYDWVEWELFKLSQQTLLPNSFG